MKEPPRLQVEHAVSLNCSKCRSQNQITSFCDTTRECLADIRARGWYYDRKRYAEGWWQNKNVYALCPEHNTPKNRKKQAPK